MGFEGRRAGRLSGIETMQPTGRQVVPGLDRSPGPLDVEAIDAPLRSQTEVEHGIGGREVAASSNLVTNQHPARERGAYVGAYRGLAMTVTQLDRQHLAAARGVSEQRSGGVKGAGGKIGPTVAVEIADGQAAAHDRLPKPSAAAVGNVGQAVASSLQQGRSHRLGDAQPCPIENMSIRLDEVEPAVAVKVLNRDAEAEHRPRGRRDPQRGRVVTVERLAFQPRSFEMRSSTGPGSS